MPPSQAWRLEPHVKTCIHKKVSAALARPVAPRPTNSCTMCASLQATSRTRRTRRCSCGAWRRQSFTPRPTIAVKLNILHDLYFLAAGDTPYTPNKEMQTVLDQLRGLAAAEPASAIPPEGANKKIPDGLRAALGDVLVGIYDRCASCCVTLFDIKCDVVLITLGWRQQEDPRRPAGGARCVGIYNS